MPEALDLAQQIDPAVAVELTLHQGVDQMHDADVAAAQLQTTRGFETQQSAADHHRLASLARFFEQRARVVQRAEDVHVLLVDAGNGRNKGAAAGGQNQLVERRLAALIVDDRRGGRDRSP